MTKQITVKNPIIKSILITFLFAVFPFLAGIAVTILEIGEANTLLVLAFSMIFAILTGLFIAKNSVFSFSELGLSVQSVKSLKVHVSYLPIIAIELIALISGFGSNLITNSVFSIFIFFFFICYRKFWWFGCRS